MPVLSAFPSAQGAFLVADQGVASPVVVDPEREVFRHLKVANAAFPLNLVIDREGRVAHVDNELEYTTEAAAAVIAEVEK